MRTAGDLSLSVSGGGDHARATVDVPPAKWAETIRAVRDDPDLACDFFDWLSAVDELDEGYTVVAHLWSTTKRHGLLLRTRVTKGPGSKAAGLAMAFKLLEAAQGRWRAVNGPHLVALVRAGARFDKEVMIERPDEPVQEVAA